MPVCILAGGSSKRFGSPKGLAQLEGVPLLDRVLDRIRKQSDGPIVLNAATDGPYTGAALPIISDQVGGDIGPLAGIHAAMSWGLGAGFDRIITCTLDTPFIPQDFVLQLAKHDGPAICASGERLHPVLGIWPCNLADELRATIEGGNHSVHAWSSACNALKVEFALEASGRDPFYNINTRQDLRNAQS